MAEAVLGPGARGVVIVADDPKRAFRARTRLLGAGIPAATADELGLRLPDDLHRRIRSPEDLGTYWAVALRRPVLAHRTRGRFSLRDARGAVPPVRRGDRRPFRMILAGRPTPRVAVFGGAWVEEGEREYGEARGFGERLASAGVQVVCGGYGGIMAALCRGAAEAGGVAVGVTIGSWRERVRPNRWMTHEVVARLPLIFDAEAWVAFSGGAGTLAEIALGWNLVQTRSVEARPIVLLGDRWGRALDALRPLLLIREQSDFELVRRAASADEAADLALALGVP